MVGGLEQNPREFLDKRRRASTVFGAVGFDFGDEALSEFRQGESNRDLAKKHGDRLGQFRRLADAFRRLADEDVEVVAGVALPNRQAASENAAKAVDGAVLSGKDEDRTLGINEA